MENLKKLANSCSLKMSNLIIEKINFSRGYNIENGKVKVDFDYDIDCDKNNNNLVTLKCQIQKNSELSLEIVISAIFTIDENVEDLPNSIRKEILEKNTISILFPYLRSAITNITCQPNLIPIVLPPININSLLDALRSKESED